MTKLSFLITPPQSHTELYSTPLPERTVSLPGYVDLIKEFCILIDVITSHSQFSFLGFKLTL